MKNRILLLGLMTVCWLTTAYTRPPSALSDAAQQFLSTLDKDQRQQATYPMDAAERYDWHYTPRERAGLPLKAMTDQQQQAARHLMQTTPSQRGYQKATDIMRLENILREIEGRGPDDTYRDPLNYAFIIFGNPEDELPWGWRIEGHHVSLHFTVAGNTIVSATPTFLGANPAQVPSGPKKGWRVLQPEEDLARALVTSLPAEQGKVALIAEVAYPEIVTGTGRYAQVEQPAGLSYADMSKVQQDQLIELLEVYYRVHRAEVAQQELAAIREAGLDKLYFGWAGGIEPGEPHYYRIQGPTLVIEYDNTQNKANHIHTVVRNLQNDWGEDVLGEHYKAEH